MHIITTLTAVNVTKYKIQMNNLPIVHKAFTVYHEGMLGFGPEIFNEVSEIPIVYAKTPSEAKSKSTEWRDWELDGDTPKWTDAKVKRSKNSDIVIFEGKEVKRYQIESILRTRKRIKKLESFLNDPVLTHCYIMKRGSYYRPGSRGYTSIKHRAGIYTINEGVSDAISCEDLWLERTSIKDHNDMLEKHIEETKELMIK